MDDDNLMDVNFTDLDLNMEPTDPGQVSGVGTLLDEMENSRDRIAQRFRQLEAAVSARAINRQRWRQARSNVEIISPFPSETVGETGVDGSTSLGVMERCAEKGKGCKRDSSHLVAKALEMDADVRKADKEGGSFYDCNICLEIATEPVVTVCGHLFCWACFYQVSYVDSTNKECPVCKGEVSDSTVIPIFGNGGGERVHVSESGLKIPPRPKARRVEGVRQRRLSQGISHVPVAEALRRIRISIGALGEHALDHEARIGVRRPDTESTEGQIVGETSGPRRRINQVSRVLSESAASLSSLSSVLSSAERLVTDLQSDMHDNFPRALPADGGVPPGILLPNDQPIDLTADTQASSSTYARDNLHDRPMGPTHATTGPITRMRSLRSAVASDIAREMQEGPTTVAQRRRNLRIMEWTNRDDREVRRRRLN